MLINIYAQLQNRLHELSNEQGATAAEYGLLVALIAAFIIGAVTLLGQNIDAVFRQVAAAI